MFRSIIFITLFFLSNHLLSHPAYPPVYWGFFGHRLINRMAVYTLPSEMIGLFKKEIDFIAEHAVDADKRRYATPVESVRHYIDIDHWEEDDYPLLEQRFEIAQLYFSSSLLINRQDTFSVSIQNGPELFDSLKIVSDSVEFQIDKFDYLKCYSTIKQELIENGSALIPLNSFIVPQPDSFHLLLVDSFSTHGILPYHLELSFQLLKQAFYDKDIKRILRLATDIGHYVADAHVPLHTSENYNGQLTGQLGIHAFWESRLPELYAENTYDFLVGQARYIPDIHKFIWGIIWDTHTLVDSVLHIEKRLSQLIPEDRQYCFEERLDRTVRLPCEEYAWAYHKEMNGMVEEQMRKSISALGSIWYTAWVEAGQPDLLDSEAIEFTMKELEDFRELDQLSRIGKVLGRKHE